MHLVIHAYIQYELLTSDRLPPLNVTACLAVDIRHLPPGLEFTNTAQKSPLTIDDLLLSSKDGEVLVKRAVRYVMEFLVTHFKDLASMAKFVLRKNVHIQCRSQQ